MPGVYRIEAYIARRPGGPPVPWMVSNPIYVGLTRPAPRTAVEPRRAPRIPARVDRGDHGVGPRRSRAQLSRVRRSIRGRGELPASRRSPGRSRLSPGTPAGQFAAVQIPIIGGLAAFDRVRFSVSSPKPMRAWVQLRAPVGNTERWGTTFYADAEARMVDVPLARSCRSA